MNKSKVIGIHDYGFDDIDIQTAMVHHAKANPNKEKRSRFILWNGSAIYTSYELKVPKEGRFRLEFLSKPFEPLQGVDIEAENGCIFLVESSSVEILRTWNDPKFESSIEYSYRTTSGKLNIWNVYVRVWPDGRRTEEKWVGNSGFMVEQESKNCLIFRCSGGSAKLPDFSQLEFRFTLLKSR